MLADTTELTENQRKRTILRMDGGGGEDDNIHWVLARGYHLLVKVKNWRRAKKLCASVTCWYADPKVPGRELGWVLKNRIPMCSRLANWLCERAKRMEPGASMCWSLR